MARACGAGAATALKERERDERDDEIARLKSKVGEITKDNELLYAKIEALRDDEPDTLALLGLLLRGGPSHSYHCYMMANLRLVLAAEVASGNHHPSRPPVGVVGWVCRRTAAVPDPWRCQFRQ